MCVCVCVCVCVCNQPERRSRITSRPIEGKAVHEKLVVGSVTVMDEVERSVLLILSNCRLTFDNMNGNTRQAMFVEALFIKIFAVGNQ